MTTPSTTPCSLGDVLLLNVAFTDLSDVKRRPAVVVNTDEYNGSCPDAVIVPITSRVAAPLRLGDSRIADWPSAGLVRASVAKGKPTTVARSTIERKLGSMASDDLRGVLANLKAILG